MRKASLILFGCAVLFLSGCGNKPKDLIVGKWESSEGDKKETVEFKKDGTVETSDKMKMGKGAKYKFTDDTTMELSIEFPEEEYKGLKAFMELDKSEGDKPVLDDANHSIKMKMKVEVTKDELTMTPLVGKDQKAQKFKKVK